MKLEAELQDNGTLYLHDSETGKTVFRCTGTQNLDPNDLFDMTLLRKKNYTDENNGHVFYV